MGNSVIVSRTDLEPRRPGDNFINFVYQESFSGDTVGGYSGPGVAYDALSGHMFDIERIWVFFERDKAAMIAAPIYSFVLEYFISGALTYNYISKSLTTVSAVDASGGACWRLSETFDLVFHGNAKPPQSNATLYHILEAKGTVAAIISVRVFGRIYDELQTGSPPNQINPQPVTASQPLPVSQVPPFRWPLTKR